MLEHRKVPHFACSHCWRLARLMVNLCSSLSFVNYFFFASYFVTLMNPFLWELAFFGGLKNKKKNLSSFHSCPRSFASGPTVHFSDNISALSIILRYTSRPKGFIYLYEVKMYYAILRHFGNHTVYTYTITADQTWVSMNAVFVQRWRKKNSTRTILP